MHTTPHTPPYETEVVTAPTASKQSTVNASLLSSTEFVRTTLRLLSQEGVSRGMPAVAVEGKLLRPLAAYAMAQALSPDLLESRKFWSVVLALQMAHEASLVHDDILDEAKERRGRPTLYARKGVGAALVFGDHLLTASYTWLSEAMNAPLFRCYTESVERTVAGEVAQARCVGSAIDEKEYQSIIRQKTGYLFGFALTIAPRLLDHEQAECFEELGRNLGSLYQMLDDLLDYCPYANTGKPPFQDYYQRKTTYPWLTLPKATQTWELPAEQLHKALFAPQEKEASHASWLRRDFRARCAQLKEKLVEMCPHHPTTLLSLLDQWVQKADEAMLHEENLATATLSDSKTQNAGKALSMWRPGNALHSQAEAEASDTNLQARPSQHRAYKAPLTSLVHQSKLRSMLDAEHLLQTKTWAPYFAKHSRSFSFASLLFPAQQRQQVAGIYAFCRFTDDLADDYPELGNQERDDLLDQWQALTAQVYAGESTGISLLDNVIGQMRRDNVPLHYASDLIKGVRMDLTRKRYEDMDLLCLYCYRVASTVGLWMTEQFGVKNPWVLSRAASLGEAMQLTNILRDVGEDLNNGRIYLPQDRMRAHGIDEALLQAMAQGKHPINDDYRALIEELLQLAEWRYQEAFSAIPALPAFFQRPVATAAYIYRGIHRSLRANDYNNFQHRAYTTVWRKLWLGFSALRDLRRERREFDRVHGPELQQLKQQFKTPGHR